MSLNGINTYAAQTTPKVETTRKDVKEKTQENAVADANAQKTGFSKDAAVYEKGAQDVVRTKSSKVNPKVDNKEIVAKMKADAEARTEQLRSLVEKMMAKQGQKIAEADDMWKFLASGKYTVPEDVKAQAQKDIAEDGYWGVEQTSDRIVDFAKALSGGDVSKADTLLKAFKKGFREATKAWGKELPEISQRTYKAVEEKFAAWKNGTEEKKQDKVNEQVAKENAATVYKATQSSTI